jgi:hypothetical protein
MIHDPVQWESWTPHPSALRKGGDGMQKQVEELAPIALSGPRLGGSSHGYTFWTYLNASKRQYARMALPRPAKIKPTPAETNTSHAAKKPCRSVRTPPRLRGLHPRVR